MHPSLLVVLVGLLYLIGFWALTVMRRERLSYQFMAEVLACIAVGSLLILASVPLHPVLFLAIVYFVTMRVRLLVDLGNWLTSKGRFEQALGIYQVALRLGADTVSRQIVLINRGVTQLRTKDPEAAYLTLKEALDKENSQPGAKYLAAGYYNLGLACRRTGREALAIRYFNQAIDTLPTSIYAHGAKQALKKQPPNQPDPGP